MTLTHIESLHMEEEQAILEWLRKNRKPVKENGNGYS